MSSSDHIDRVVQSEAQPIRARGLLYHLVHNPKLIYTSSFLALCFWTFVGTSDIGDLVSGC